MIVLVALSDDRLSGHDKPGTAVATVCCRIKTTPPTKDPTVGHLGAMALYVFLIASYSVAADTSPAP